MAYGIFRADASLFLFVLLSFPVLLFKTALLSGFLQSFPSFLHCLFCSPLSWSPPPSTLCCPGDLGPSWVGHLRVGCSGCSGHALPLGLECISSSGGGRPEAPPLCVCTCARKHTHRASNDLTTCWMGPLTLCVTLQCFRGDSSSREVSLDDLLRKRLQTVIPWAGVSLQMNLVRPSQCGFFFFFY